MFIEFEYRKCYREFVGMLELMRVYYSNWIKNLKYIIFIYNNKKLENEILLLR